MSRRNNPLGLWLRVASNAQRDELARLCGTSVPYLFSLAACRRQPRVGLALAIETTTREMHQADRTLPVVTVRDLAQMSALEGLV